MGYRFVGKQQILLLFVKFAGRLKTSPEMTNTLERGRKCMRPVVIYDSRIHLGPFEFQAYFVSIVNRPVQP